MLTFDGALLDNDDAFRMIKECNQII